MQLTLYESGASKSRSSRFIHPQENTHLSTVILKTLKRIIFLPGENTDLRNLNKCEYSNSSDSGTESADVSCIKHKKKQGNIDYIENIDSISEN